MLMYFCTLPTSGCISHLHLRLDYSSSQKQGYDCRQLYVYGSISKAPIQTCKARSLAHDRGVCVLQPPSLPLPSQVTAVQALWHNSPLRVASNHSGSLYGVLIVPASIASNEKPSIMPPSSSVSRRTIRPSRGPSSLFKHSPFPSEDVLHTSPTPLSQGISYPLHLPPLPAPKTYTTALATGVAILPNQTRQSPPCRCMSYKAKASADFSSAWPPSGGLEDKCTSLLLWRWKRFLRMFFVRLQWPSCLLFGEGERKQRLVSEGTATTTERFNRKRGERERPGDLALLGIGYAVGRHATG